MQTFPQLETQRLILRQIIASDVPAIYQIHSDAAHMRWFGTELAQKSHDVEPFIAAFNQWQGDKIEGIRWGIQKKESDTLIGTCGLFRWHHGWQKCMLGYELSATSIGQGYMAESLAAVIGWTFQHTNLNRIEAMVHMDNQASMRVLGKQGFTQEGLLRQSGYWHGQFHDMLMLSLLRQDWAKAPQYV